MLSHMDKVLGTRADGYDELHGPRHDHDEGHAAHHEGHLQPRRLAGRAALARWQMLDQLILHCLLRALPELWRDAVRGGDAETHSPS